MKKILLVLLIGFTFASCEKKIVGPVIDASVSLSFVNSKGDDLLNPNTLGSFSEQDIDIFILVNGSKNLLYQGNLDASKFFKIRTDNGKNSFHMFFDITPVNFKNDKITQYIRFKDGSEIEVVGEFNADRKRNKILQQIWVNGLPKTKIETENSSQSPIVVVK